jgi:hypothetical protein
MTLTGISTEAPRFGKEEYEIQKEFFDMFGGFE